MNQKLKGLFVFVAFLFLFTGLQSQNTIANASTVEEPSVRIVTPEEYNQIIEKVDAIEKANPGIVLTKEQLQQIVNDLGFSDIKILSEEETNVPSSNSNQMRGFVSAGGVGFEQFSRTSTHFKAQAHAINIVPATTIDSITGYIAGYSQVTGSNYVQSIGRNFTATAVKFGNTKVLDVLSILHYGKDAKYTINATVVDGEDKLAVSNTIISHPNGEFTNN